MGKISIITQLMVPVYVTMYSLKITIIANVAANHPLSQKNVANKK